MRKLITLLLLLAGFSAAAQSTNDPIIPSSRNMTDSMMYEGVKYYVHGEIDTVQVLIQYTDTAATKDYTIKMVKGYIVSNKGLSVTENRRFAVPPPRMWLDADKKRLSGIVVWNYRMLRNESSE